MFIFQALAVLVAAFVSGAALHGGGHHRRGFSDPPTGPSPDRRPPAA